MSDTATVGVLEFPKSVVENPHQRARTEFPEGTYHLDIVEVRRKEIDRNGPMKWLWSRTTKNGEPRQPNIANDGFEMITVKFGNARPLDNESGNPGKSYLFQDFLTYDGEHFALSTPQGTRGVGTLLYTDAGRLTNLASALGQGEETPSGGYLPSASFVDDALNGAFNGNDVIGTVTHDVNPNSGYVNVLAHFAPVR